MAEAGKHFSLQRQLEDSPAETRPSGVKIPARLQESLIPGGKAPEIMSAAPWFVNNRSDINWASAAWRLDKLR